MNCNSLIRDQNRAWLSPPDVTRTWRALSVYQQHFSVTVSKLLFILWCSDSSKAAVLTDEVENFLKT